jgi:hypothetical protein
MEATSAVPRIGTDQLGLFRGLSYDDYVRIDALRFSDAKLFRKSALHARHEQLNPSDDSRATFLGTALHAAVLEPQNFGKLYAVGPKVDKRTKAGKAEWIDFEQSNSGALLLRGEEYESLAGMAEAVIAHPFIQAIVARPSHREIVFVWDENGTSCKCRIDWTVAFEGETFVIDLKSCRDASPDGFARSINEFKYHGQAASYLRGMKAAKPAARDRRWLWVAVESEAPHGVAIYQPSDGLLEQGEQEYLGWVRQYAHCRRTNSWPGYPVQIQPIDLPKWAWRNERTEEEVR